MLVYSFQIATGFDYYFLLCYYAEFSPDKKAGAKSFEFSNEARRLQAKV